VRAQWSRPLSLGSLESVWDDTPDTPGVYLILAARPIGRIGGVDRRGILYVGKARNLRNRLWQFWYADHNASGLLWTQPVLARIVFSRTIRTVTDVEAHLGRLKAQVSTPIATRDLDAAERAVLYAYIGRYGEAPPLNFTLPRRWKAPPSAHDLRWAEQGVLSRA
jgi:hypothetical protein